MHRIPNHLLLVCVLAVTSVRPPSTATAQSLTELYGPGSRGSATRIVRPPDLKQEYYRAERAWHSGSSLLEAKSRLDRVIARLPDDHDALRLRARVVLDMGRPLDALLDLERLVALIPEDTEAWLTTAEAHLRSGHSALALAAVEKAATLVDNRSDDHLRLSWITEELGLVDQAEAHARVGLAMDPSRPVGYRRLAHVFMAQNRPDDAATLVAAAMAQGVFRPELVTEDPIIARLRSHRLLARWF